MPSTFPVRIGQEEYLLCWRLDDCQGSGSGKPAPLTFFDDVSATYFLRSVIQDSGKMQDLRVWLLDQNSTFPMYATDDNELMTRIAIMLASGELSAASMAQSSGGGGAVEGEGILRPEGEASNTQAVAQSKRVSESTPLQDEMASQSATEAEEVLAAEDEAAREPEEEPVVLDASVDAALPPAVAAQPKVEKLPELPTDSKVEETAALAAVADTEDEPPQLAAGAEAETTVVAPSVESQPAKTAALASKAEAETKIQKPAVGIESDLPAAPAAEAQIDAAHPNLATESETGETPKLKFEAEQEDTVSLSSEAETDLVKKKPVVEIAGPPDQTPGVSVETEPEETLSLTSAAETDRTRKKPAVEITKPREQAPVVSSETETSQTPELRKETSAHKPPRLDSHVDDPKKHPKLDTEMDVDNPSDDHHD